MAFKGRSNNVKITKILKSPGVWVFTILAVMGSYATTIGGYSFNILKSTYNDVVAEYGNPNGGDISQIEEYVPNFQKMNDLRDFAIDELPFTLPDFVMNMVNGKPGAFDPGNWDTNQMYEMSIEDLFPDVIFEDDLISNNYFDYSSSSIIPYDLSSNPLACLSENFEIARVLNVVDGDTILVEINGEKEYIRYIGINTPETVKENFPTERFGPEASQANEIIVPVGTMVKLYSGTEEYDQYGRLLRYVVTNGNVFVNYELVLNGYARTYYLSESDNCYSELHGAEFYAYQNGKGLWETFE